MPRAAVVLVERLQHRMCPKRSVAVASEVLVLVLNFVNGGDRAKAVAASVAGSSMLHGRMN